MERKARLLVLLLALWTATVASAKLVVEMEPQRLTCEDMANPTTIETRVPRFSWINTPLSDTLKGKTQTAWQIRVASSAKKLAKGKADLWDSKKTVGNDSYLVCYFGKPLKSGQEAWWQVRVWDERGVVSGWSKPACFGVGLDAKDWKAQWIGAPWQGEKATTDDSIAPMFRKEVYLKDKVSKAKAYITAMGFFELYANGTRVSDDCLVPGFTNFTRREGLDKANIPISDRFRDYRVLYLAYDITDLVQKGENALGVLLGNGWANPSHRLMAPFGSPRFLCQLDITYANGRRELVVTDESWLVKESPIRHNDIYSGEVYDARLEEPLWASVGCNTSGWQHAVLRKAPDGKLTAQDAPVDKVLETLRPTSLTHSKTGEWTVEFDHEVSGRIHLRGISGQAGQQLSIQYVCESPLGVDKYIFKGEGKEEHAARFTWYVFSKAVITGVEHLTPDMITAECIGTDVPVDARFFTSDRLLNQINTIWQQSQTDNMHCAVASDCPHRERAPYTGDGQVACPTVMENFDAAAFYRKWLRDMRDTQNVDDGYVPNGAPWQPICGGGVAWGAAMNIIPWELYVHTGDIQVLRENYFAMKEQLRHMQQSITPEGIMFQQKTSPEGQPLYWLNLGDWSPAFGLPKDELVHTFYLWYCAELTARAARVLEDHTFNGMNVVEDSYTFRELAQRTREAFHRKFYDAEVKSYGDFGSNVLALYMGVPDSVKADVVRTLEHEIADTYKSHLNTGIFGTRFLFEVLCANGLSELALQVLRQRDFPGFGNWIAQGATVTWEAWDGSNSHNHPMFGGGLVSLYRDFAGVRIDEKKPGYRHVVIRPFLSPSLPRVGYEKMTPYGLLRSEVRREGENYRLTVTVPVGTTATVVLPNRAPETLSQGIHTLMCAR
jgi:alpha-L-rhamnosidase